MISNYGFEDASGIYYIRIDTDKCADCIEKGCIKGCPASVFVLEEDDWDHEVAVVKDGLRNALKLTCAYCKPLVDHPESLPCQNACGRQAIVHTW